MQKSLNLIDLVKNFHTSICLPNSASYSQERASRSLVIQFTFSFASLSAMPPLHDYFGPGSTQTVKTARFFEILRLPYYPYPANFHGVGRFALFTDLTRVGKEKGCFNGQCTSSDKFTASGHARWLFDIFFVVGIHLPSKIVDALSSQF